MVAVPCCLGWRLGRECLGRNHDPLHSTALRMAHFCQVQPRFGEHSMIVITLGRRTLSFAHLLLSAWRKATTGRVLPWKEYVQRSVALPHVKVL